MRGALLLYGRPDEAIGHARHALVLNPDLRQARQVLAAALRKTGRFDEAMAVLAEPVGRPGPLQGPAVFAPTPAAGSPAPSPDAGR